MILGVTGPFASGKSYAVSYFRRKGFGVIDVDTIGHEVLERPNVQTALRKAFGPAVFFESGRVDRKKLGSLVFGRSGPLKKLNHIVHPAMINEVQKRLDLKNAGQVIDAALLFEMGLDRFCDKIILVSSPVKEILKRGMKRNGFGAGRIKSILASQRSLNANRLKSHFQLENDATLGAFRKKLAAVYTTIKNPGR